MPERNIHATCVAIGASGVLLIGPSGSGKSDLALRLIDDGAILVADDRTILYTANGKLQARGPATIAGLLEIRSVGIVKFPVRKSVAVRLVVKLGREGARLPRPRVYRTPTGLDAAPVPEILLHGFHAATPAKIRAALTAFSKGLFRDTFVTK